MSDPSQGTQKSQPLVELINEYGHILENFVPLSLLNLPAIGNYLGFNVFLPSDRFLVLYQKYRYRSFGKVCGLCDQIRVHGLVLNFNSQPSILREITVTKFPNLHTLDLSGNNLESIEQLVLITSSKLKLLSLSGNKMTRLDSLTRACYSHECILDLTGNPYLQLPTMMLSGTVEFDNRIVDKAKLFKTVMSLKAVQKNGAKLMVDYFR